MSDSVDKMGNSCETNKPSKKVEMQLTGDAKSGKYESIRLYICTWNVGGAGPPKDLTDLLDLTAEKLPEIYAIGFQEMDPRDSDTKSNMWTSKLMDVLVTHNYVMIKVVRMQAISLQVFVRRDMLLHVTSVESEYSKAGMGGWWGNKGGVSIRFDIGGVNLIVLSTHLAAHMENVAERIEDFNTVLRSQKFRDPDVENVLDHDYVFWAGDLNFRLDNASRTAVMQSIQENDLNTLLKADQLNRAIEEGLIFTGFQEGPIDFKPTYKFDTGTDTYDTSEKQRIPAWCDRILYRVQKDLPGLGAKKKKYKTAQYNVGDHKPVTASFDVNIFNSTPEPFVIFDPIKEWKYGKSQKFHYFVRKGIEPDTSPWDWIGLYKSTFRHFEEYMTYVWGKNDAEDRGKKGVTLEFKGKSLEVPPGTYVLCYISKYKGWLRAMTNEFQIVS